MAKQHAGNPMHSEDVRAAYAGHNIVLKEDELTAPLRLRKPARIGVQFMGDLFLEGVGIHWQGMVWDVMERCPQHTFVVLTKRPRLMLEALDRLVESHGVLNNVWLGVTVENQQRADERIPLLLQCPAKVRWASVEPMLDVVDLQSVQCDHCKWDVLNGCQYNIENPGSQRNWQLGTRRLDWIICGAESGSGARWMDPDDARDLRDQCHAAGVAFFMKQMSNKAPIPEDLMVREYPA